MRTRWITLPTLLATVVTAAEPATKPAAPPSLKLTIPAGWQDVSKPPSPDRPGPAAIRLATHEQTGIFAVTIVFLRAPGQADAFDDEALGMLLQKAATPYLDGSDQNEIKPQALDGQNVHGYFTTLTAKDAKADESPCVTLVHARLSDGLLAVTIQHPDGSPNLPKALDMIKTASLGPAAATKPVVTKPADKPTGKPAAKPIGRVKPSPTAK